MSKIARIDNVLPDTLIEKLHKQISNQTWKYGWHSNGKIGYSHWNNSFVKAGADNGLDMADELPTEELKQAWEYIRTLYAKDHILLRCYTNAHTYGVEGYPHTDSMREQDKTILVYINKDWRKEWGGETVVFDNNNNIIASQLPKFNTGLLFPGNHFHCARPPSRICPELRITLMFKIAPKGYDLLRDQLQKFITDLGTKDIKHKNGKLFNHLMRTYDMLNRQGADSYTSAAGGLHSIMSTEHFQRVTLDPKFAYRITELFGPQVTELVGVFSQIKKTQTLELACKNKSNKLTMRNGEEVEFDPKLVESLCLIEAANLQDQSSLNKYEHLKEFWNNYDGKTQSKSTTNNSESRESGDHN